MVHPKHQFEAAPAQSLIKRGLSSDYVNVEGGTVSASILRQTDYATNERGILERNESFVVSVYDSAALQKSKIGADSEGRFGFATHRQAEVARAAFLEQVAASRGRG